MIKEYPYYGNGYNGIRWFESKIATDVTLALGCVGYFGEKLKSVLAQVNQYSSLFNCRTLHRAGSSTAASSRSYRNLEVTTDR
jgi:hypothetical protein